jgi:hypothetical protein
MAVPYLWKTIKKLCHVLAQSVLKFAIKILSKNKTHNELQNIKSNQSLCCPGSCTLQYP